MVEILGKCGLCFSTIKEDNLFVETKINDGNYLVCKKCGLLIGAIIDKYLEGKK